MLVNHEFIRYNPKNLYLKIISLIFKFYLKPITYIYISFLNRDIQVLPIFVFYFTKLELCLESLRLLQFKILIAIVKIARCKSKHL